LMSSLSSLASPDDLFNFFDKLRGSAHMYYTLAMCICLIKCSFLLNLKWFSLIRCTCYSWWCKCGRRSDLFGSKQPLRGVSTMLHIVVQSLDFRGVDISDHCLCLFIRNWYLYYCTSL